MGRVPKFMLLCTLLPMMFLMNLSPAAASSAATGPCDDVTATTLGEQYDLNPFAPNTTAMSALCGEFLGPGIEAMIARAIPATCGGYAGWAAFRRQSDDSWQLVWRYRNGQSDLVAVGSDLGETNRILAPRDARCVGETATKTRTWHWTGQQFEGSPWSIRPLGLAPSFITEWSHAGIICQMADDPKVETLPGSVHNGVSCFSVNSHYSLRAELLVDARVKMKKCKEGLHSQSQCTGSYCGCADDFTKVKPGEQVVVGRFTCRVLKSSVECVNATGQGFVINPRKTRSL
jgi:hypothetical protein